MSTVSLDENLYSALEEAVGVLRSVAEYELDDEAKKRMRELGENKAACTVEEREIHRQLADFWRQRTLQKVQALNSLKRLHQVAPQLVGELPQSALEQ